MSAGCPLYPQKRTWIGKALMSALCQKQTLSRLNPNGGNKQRAHRTDTAMHLNVPAANTLQSWPF
jgi:hypothetical protein